MTVFTPATRIVLCAILCGCGLFPGASTRAETPAPAEAAVDCLVVCPTDFREAVSAWTRYRESEGLTVRVVDSASTTAQVMERLRAGGLTGATQFIVLIGDCRISTAESADPAREVPTHYRPVGPSAKFSSTETLASDAFYGDLDGDGVPEVAVGRLTVDTADQLTAWIERIKAYEASDDFGQWRDRVQITAGVGGFGFVADTAIETATRGILTSSLPPAVQLAVTYASPSSAFYPGPIDFFPATLRRYREGGMFWVYMGHGSITELDRVPGPNGQRRPVLNREDVPLLERPADGAPIAVMLACYTGAFDATVDCLAEHMVHSPGGPVAVLAGSRVTMPYGNALAAQGLIHAVYEQRTERLGTAWLQAQRELATEATVDTELNSRRGMVDMVARALSPDVTQLPAERLEHIHLYNLLGDPTLRLRHPQEISLEVPKGIKQGQPVAVRGKSQQGGRLVVTLCHLPGNAPVDESLTMAERYEQANCVDVVSTELDNHAGGAFEVTLDAPDVTTGRYRIVARIQDEEGWSTGAASILILPR